MIGNDLWWSQVQEIHEEMGEVHFTHAELELFYRLYQRMKEDAFTKTQIREHFEQMFNIKKHAFYTRLRKVGMKYVL